MYRKRMLLRERLENRFLLAGDVPTFDDGVFALPESAEDLVSFEVRRMDDVTASDRTMLIAFATDDEDGSLDSIRSAESYDIKALARARNRVVYFGSDVADYQMKGSTFVSFAVIQDAHVNDWLRAKTQLTEQPEIGFLFSLEENAVADVRALGNQRWELQWHAENQSYTYEIQWESDEFAADVLLESFVNAETADDPPGVLVETGDFVSRNYTVTNPGDMALTNVVVVDNNSTPDDPEDDFEPDPNEVREDVNLGDLDEDQELDPGEVWIFSAPTTAVEGQYSSETVVTAVAGERAVSTSDTANYLASSPDLIDLAIVDATSNPEPFDAAGQLLYEVGRSYEFRPVVRNTGNVSLQGPFEVGTRYRDEETIVAGGQVLAPNQELELGAVEVTEDEVGVFLLEVELDPNDLFDEVDESDASNVWSAQLEFTRPDVSVVDFVATPTPLDRTEVGEELTYDLAQAYELRPVIRNTGRIPVDGPFQVAIHYRNESLEVEGSQQLLPGQTLLLEPIVITENESGEYSVEFILDPDNQLMEADESVDSNRFVELLRFG